MDQALPWVLWGVGVAALLGWLLTRREDEAEAPPSTKPSARARSADASSKSAKNGKAAASTKSKADASAEKSEAKPAAKSSGIPILPRYSEDDEDADDDDITRVTLSPSSDPQVPIEVAKPAKPASTVPIIYDEEAAVDEPTGPVARILVSAVGQTDRGKVRKANEDSYLILKDHDLFMVADGMGGYAGGEIASKLAVDTVAEAFRDSSFRGSVEEEVPRRAGELALAIKMANAAILEHAQREKKLEGMGTTVVSARFSPTKERLYVGHVGDSRCYRLRGDTLQQVTTDHTIGQLTGIGGPTAAHLVRAVGNRKNVLVDLIIAKPMPEDIYLLCSDGLSKMATDEQVREILVRERADIQKAVDALIAFAIAQGGKDNVTIILVQVRSGLKAPTVKAS